MPVTGGTYRITAAVDDFQDEALTDQTIFTAISIMAPDGSFLVTKEAMDWDAINQEFYYDFVTKAGLVPTGDPLPGGQYQWKIEASGGIYDGIKFGRILLTPQRF